MIPRAFACAMVTSTDLRTSKAHIFKIYLSFFRYGGLTFGEVRDIVPDKLTKVPYDDIRRLFVKEAAKVRH